MARGRFISRDVSTSGKLADLETDTARMLWAFVMAFADRDARVTGNTDELRATVVPRLSHITASDITRTIRDWQNAGLADWYTDDQGREVIQFWNFAYQQKGMKYDREAPSKFGPNPDGSALGPETSGGVRPKVKPKKKSKSKLKTKAKPAPLPDDWKPTKEHMAFAAEHELDLEIEVVGFRGWAEGELRASWNGTFATRLSNSVKWRRERKPVQMSTPAWTPEIGEAWNRKHRRIK